MLTTSENTSIQTAIAYANVSVAFIKSDLAILKELVLVQGEETLQWIGSPVVNWHLEESVMRIRGIHLESKLDLERRVLEEPPRQIAKAVVSWRRVGAARLGGDEKGSLRCELYRGCVGHESISQREEDAP